MKIIIDLDSSELNQAQRVGLAALLEAGNSAGTLTVTNTDEPAKEPLKEEEPAPAPKRRTRKKAEPKPAEDPSADAEPAEAVKPGQLVEDETPAETSESASEEASEPASTEELEAEAISVASPVIRKGPESKAKVRAVLEDLGVERITELAGNREGLEKFITSVRAIEA